MPFLRLGVFLLMGLWILGCQSGGKKEQVPSSSSYKGYGSESVSRATLQKFTPPAFEPELARKIQSLLDVRAPGMGMIHPDGKRLFFSWRVTGVSQIWRMDRPEGFPVPMTGGEDSTQLQGITPDGKYLILSRDRNGEENPGLYFQSVDGGPLQMIQHIRKVQTHFELVSPDSEWVYFRSNDVEADSYAIYNYSLKTKQKELVFAKKGYWTILDSRPDGRLLLNMQISNSANEVFEWTPANRFLRPLFGQGEKQEYQVVYGPRDDEYFLITPRGEFRGLYHWYKGKETALAPQIKGDVISVGIDDSRKHVAFVSNQSAYMKLHTINARTLATIEVPLPKDADHTYSGFQSRDGRYMMVGVETAYAPRSSFSYDFVSGRVTRWVIPSIPETDPRRFVRAELTDYTARDGTKIPMFVRKPSQCERQTCPVVVHFHGGPEGQSLPGFSVFAQMFIDEGFIFVEPNVRGSEGYGQMWLHSDNGPKRLKVITDIADAAKAIRERFTVNGQAPKVGVMGWSYGGYSTLYAMTKFAGSYDAGVSLVGISNLLTFLENTAPYRRAMRIPEYGDPEKDREALQELSPVTHLALLKDPLLVIQGAEDPRVPVGEAVSFYNEMQGEGIPGGLIIFADEGHGSQKRSNQVLELGNTIAFFKKHLK